MLKRKALKRIGLTTLVLFIMLITFSLELINTKTNSKLEEIEYVSNLNTTHIYLLNKENYLVKVDTLINTEKIEDMARCVLKKLYISNNKYHNLKGLIPSNTKINKIEYQNDTIIIDFSKDLLAVNKKLEEKVIESIVYTLLEIKGISNIQIKIDGKILNKLEKSNITLPDVLDNSIGINKTFNINSLKDIKCVVLYYVFNNDYDDYYVPVYKYINSKDSKIKIIIDSLNGSYTSSTNLRSYLSYKNSIKDYKLDNDTLTITFNSLNDLNLESVTYLLSSSVFNSTNDIKRVIFENNKEIVAIKLNK
ncbi:MAG: GerMN domain-containing protein [Erysipelotrichaceae bacterium]|nr:GerMN domain-containing protein [Erysipelotrichaceae bacterium]